MSRPGGDLGGRYPALSTLLRHAEFRRDRLEAARPTRFLGQTPPRAVARVPYRDGTQIAELVRSETFESEMTAAGAAPPPGAGPSVQRTAAERAGSSLTRQSLCRGHGL